MPDVFISYTHTDNARLSDERHGWVDLFHEALKLQLYKMWGREVSVWRDHKLAGNDMLTSTIEEKLRESTLLLAIVSPGYLHSDWCAKELRMFCECAKTTGGLRIGTKSRIIRVKHAPVKPESESAIPEIADCVDHEFFQLSEKGVPWYFDPSGGQEARQEFMRKIIDLAHDICRTLEARDESEAHCNPIAPVSGQYVYLAESSTDLSSQCDRLRSELEQYGHIVLPVKTIPPSPEYADAVRADLERCRLSIHPIGTRYGVIPEGYDTSIVEIQYQLALEESKRRPSFTPVPWTLPGAKPEDPRLRALLKRVIQDGEFRITSFESLKSGVQDLLTSKPRSVANANEKTSVYIIYDACDARSAAPYEEWLLSHGYDVEQPLTVGDESEFREDHEENLRTCDAALIFNGNTNQFWLHSKVRDLKKAFGYGRQRPFLAKAVLLADPGAPERPEKEQFRSNEVLVLNGFGGFSESILQPFVNSLNATHGDAAQGKVV